MNREVMTYVEETIERRAKLELPVTDRVYSELYQLLEDKNLNLTTQQRIDLQYCVVHHHMLAYDMYEMDRLIKNSKTSPLKRFIRKLFKK